MQIPQRLQEFIDTQFGDPGWDAYDNGFKDAVESTVLAMLGQGISEELIMIIFVTVSDAFGNNT